VAYLPAESMVSTKVDKVCAEADKIEPGWSQVIAPTLIVLVILYHLIDDGLFNILSTFSSLFFFTI
jgi:hypothetical protein